MSNADKITVTILPTGAMHADLTWLLIAPSKMLSRSGGTEVKRDWVELPTHVVYIEHPNGQRMLGGGNKDAITHLRHKVPTASDSARIA